MLSELQLANKASGGAALTSVGSMMWNEFS